MREIGAKAALVVMALTSEVLILGFVDKPYKIAVAMFLGTLAFACFVLGGYLHGDPSFGRPLD